MGSKGVGREGQGRKKAHARVCYICLHSGQQGYIPPGPCEANRTPPRIIHPVFWEAGVPSADSRPIG